MKGAAARARRSASTQAAGSVGYGASTDRGEGVLLVAVAPFGVTVPVVIGQLQQITGIGAALQAEQPAGQVRPVRLP